MEVLGHGSLVQRDKTKPRSRCRKWELSAMVDEGGKRRRKTRSFSGTYSQGQEALAAFVEELRGTPVTSDMTFAEWVDVWNGRRVASRAYSERTLSTDAEKLAPALSKFSGRAIGSITGDDIRDLYASVMAGDTPSGRPWTPGSVSRMRTSMTKLFSDAVAEGIVASSPVSGVPIPKVDEGNAGNALEASRMDEVLSALDYSRAPHRAVALALGCGLRRSECCALSWDDVSSGSVTVHRSCDDGGNTKPTKNGRARTVPMPPIVAAGMSGARGTGMVCDMLPQSLTHWWTRHRADFGCDGYRFHDLRHSYATRLAASGVHMRVAMELCGWRSIAMAAKVYTHVSDDMQRDAVLAAFG